MWVNCDKSIIVKEWMLANMHIVANQTKCSKRLAYEADSKNLYTKTMAVGHYGNTSDACPAGPVHQRLH